MKPVQQHRTATPARLPVLLSLFLLVPFAATPAAFAKKIPNSAWKTGTLRNVTEKSQPYVYGWRSHNGVGRTVTTVYIVWQFTIENAKYIYTAEMKTKHRDEALDVTINTPVTFAVVGMDLYLRDAEGKAHKLAIETKTLRTKGSGRK